MVYNEYHPSSEKFLKIMEPLLNSGFKELIDFTMQSSWCLSCELKLIELQKEEMILLYIKNNSLKPKAFPALWKLKNKKLIFEYFSSIRRFEDFLENAETPAIKCFIRKHSIAGRELMYLAEKDIKLFKFYIKIHPLDACFLMHILRYPLIDPQIVKLYFSRHEIPVEVQYLIKKKGDPFMKKWISLYERYHQFSPEIENPEIEKMYASKLGRIFF